MPASMPRDTAHGNRWLFPVAAPKLGRFAAKTVATWCGWRVGSRLNTRAVGRRRFHLAEAPHTTTLRPNSQASHGKMKCRKRAT